MTTTEPRSRSNPHAWESYLWLAAALFVAFSAGYGWSLGKSTWPFGVAGAVAFALHALFSFRAGRQ